MKHFRLALFEDRTQAESARRSLIEVGIRAEIHAESRFAQLWFVSRSRAGLRVEVPVDQADEAAGFLFRRKGCERWLGSAIRCPECKSFRVDFPQFTEKSIFTNLAMGLMAEVGFVERQYYCENCHFMWAHSGSRAIRIRPHLAPNYFLEDMKREGQANPTSNYPRRSGPD